MSTTVDFAPRFINISSDVIFDDRNVDWIQGAAKNKIYFVCYPSSEASKAINELLSNENIVYSIQNNLTGEMETYVLNFARSFIHYWLGAPFEVASRLSFVHLAEIFKCICEGETKLSTMVDDYFMCQFYEDKLRSLFSRYDLDPSDQQ